MRIIVSLLLIFNTSLLFGQSDIWQYGHAKLDNGKVIKGQMRFDPLLQEGRLFIKSEGETISMAPNQVLFFKLSISESQHQHKFYSLPLTDKYTHFTRNYFLEVLYESKHIALLSRDFLAPERTKSYVNFSKTDDLVKVKDRNTTIINVLYMINPEQSELKVIGYKTEDPEIDIAELLVNVDMEFKLDRKMIYSVFGDLEEEVRYYIRQKQLNLRKRTELISTLDYYSQLKDQN